MSRCCWRGAPALPVAVGRDRPAAAQLLVNAGCDVIVSDDGLQHYALARDCEIVVIDGDRRFGNGWLLPAGPLRETPAPAGVRDAVVVNGGRVRCSTARFSMRLEAKSALSLIGGAVNAVERVCRTVGARRRRHRQSRSDSSTCCARMASNVAGHPLPDHAHLQAADIYFGDQRPVLMTEKDAVKCAALAAAASLVRAGDREFRRRRVECAARHRDRGHWRSAPRAREGVMDKRLLELLVCPICKGPLRSAGRGNALELVCRPDRLAYAVRDGIPVMLPEEARALSADDPLLER